MEFLDSLILGSSTPKYADEALFPSRTYKKPICNKKHCSTACTTGLSAEFEFWAYFLSEKKASRDEMRRRVHTVSKDLRFSIWVKCSGCREEQAGLRAPRGPSKDEGEMEDKDLVRLILDMCKASEASVPEAMFNILKSLKRDFPTISRTELLAVLVKHVLELPYALPGPAYCLIRMLIGSHNFYSLFERGEGDDGSPQNGREAEAVFWRALMSENPGVLDQMIDLLICYEGADVAAVPEFLRRQTGGSSPETWIKFMSARSNLEKLGDVFEGRRACHTTETGGGEETYFDFLVVQNEAIRAQEEMRMEASKRIGCLEEERDELYLQKANLAEACSSLELGLKEYQSEYVDEVKEMLYDAKALCERYERENVELRQRLASSGCEQGPSD